MPDPHPLQHVHARPFHDAFGPVAGSMHVLAAGLVGRSDAPDVVQEACIIAVRKYLELPSGGNFAAWMAAIVRNVARNHRRAERRRSLRLRLFARDPRPAPNGHRRHALPEGANPIDGQLIRAVEDLEEEARVCLLLRVVQGHSYAQIAAMLAMPEATVRSHVYRARARLAKTLESARTAHHD